MLSRRKESLRELIQHQREGSKRRDEESKRRHEESMRQIDASIRRFDESVRHQKKYEADLDRRMEKRDEESREREAQLRLLTEETRAFNREILLRNEKVYTGLIAEMEEGRKQIRANTQAVLSMLDRFNGPGEAAA